MLTLFLIIASVFAEGETQKYIRKTGHTFVEIVDGGCYEETVEGQTKYYKYKIETVDTTTIKKCQHTDATCETKSQDATDVEVTDFETVTTLPIIATVYEAEGENCATQKEIEYYYHGQCVKVTETQSEKYHVDVDSKKLVYESFPTANCEPAPTPSAKRAEGESNDIECNACLEGKEVLRCEGVPAEEESSSELETEESSSELETEESSSELETEESSSELETEESSSELETEESSSELETEQEESSSKPETEQEESSSKPGEEEEESSSKPEKPKKYYIIPEEIGYEVFEMDTCYASEKDVYMQYKAENIKKIKLCGYTDKDCKEEVNCEAIPLEGGKWVDDLTDYVALHKSGDVANDKDCTYLSEGNYKMITDKCFGDEGLYMKYYISDNKIRIKIYTDEGCNTLFEPQKEAEGLECDKCYSSEEGSEKYECGAFQTFIAVALAFVFFLF